MIRIKYNIGINGSHGNKLFQYAFGRLLAEKSGFELVGDLNSPLIKESKYTGKIMYATEPIIINDRYCKGKNLIPKKFEGKTYLLDGYFQNMEYFRNRELIKSFFEYEKPLQFHDGIIVLHLRLKDYYKHKYILKPEYYTDILDKENFDKIFIVTDDPLDENYLSHFNKYPHSIIHGEIKQDFLAIMSGKRIILSNSSFSWWAVYLGDYKQIWTYKKWIGKDHIYKLWDFSNAKVIDKDYFMFK